jgi:hypothetical protein
MAILISCGGHTDNGSEIRCFCRPEKPRARGLQPRLIDIQHLLHRVPEQLCENLPSRLRQHRYLEQGIGFAPSRHLDRILVRAYSDGMNIIHRKLEIDADIAEDRRRLDHFRRNRAAVPLNEVKEWVASWGTANELPRPAVRKIG